MTFLAGETSKSVAVEVMDDSVDEADSERFFVDLSNVTGGRA